MNGNGISDQRAISGATNGRPARRRRPILLAAVAAVLVAAAAGCGSKADTGTASSAVAAANSGTTSAPEKGSVTLDVIYTDHTNVLNNPEDVAAANAAAMAINQSGGIAGHKIVITSCNDNHDSNAATTCARRAASDHVLAVVGAYTDFGDNVDPILEQAQIASVGNVPVEGNDLTSRISFPFQSGFALQFVGEDLLMAHSNLSKVAAAILEDPQAAAAVAPAIKAVKGLKTANGEPMQYVGSVSLPTTISDYTPFVAALKKEGAQGVILVTSPQEGAGLIAAAKQFGYDMKFGIPPVNFTPQFLSSLGSAGDGLLAVASLPDPVTSTQLPGIDEFKAEMAAAAKAGVPNASGEAVIDTGALDAWLSVYAVADAAKKVQGPLTSAALLHALNGASNVDLKGLVTWSPSAPGPRGFPRVANSRVYFEDVQDGKYHLLQATPVDMKSALSGS